MPNLLPFSPRTPYAAETLRTRFQEMTARYHSRAALPDNWQATTIGVLNSACGDEKTRHSVLKYLTGIASSKHLKYGEWWALYAWVFPHHPDECPEWCEQPGEGWHCHPALKAEIAAIERARLLEMSPAEMFTDPAYVPDPHWEFPVDDLPGVKVKLAHGTIYHDGWDTRAPDPAEEHAEVR